MYDKEIFQKMSDRSFWNLLIVSHRINLLIMGPKSLFQVEALQG